MKFFSFFNIFSYGAIHTEFRVQVSFGDGYLVSHSDFRVLPFFLPFFTIFKSFNNLYQILHAGFYCWNVLIPTIIFPPFLRRLAIHIIFRNQVSFGDVYLIMHSVLRNRGLGSSTSGGTSLSSKEALLLCLLSDCEINILRKYIECPRHLVFFEAIKNVYCRGVKSPHVQRKHVRS